MQGTQLATSVLYELTRLILHPQRVHHARLAARHRRLDAPDFLAGLLEHASQRLYPVFHRRPLSSFCRRAGSQHLRSLAFVPADRYDAALGIKPTARTGG
jgi:hypothetical protein